MSAIAKGDASPRAPGVFVGRDGVDIEPWDDAPYVCPGCYAVGDERCAPDCIDAEIAREADDFDDDDTCIKDDCTECDCSRCEADDRRWESWQGWDAPEYGGDADDGEIPF